MNRIIMLGTGNAMVTKCYNTCFAIDREEGILLVDGGGGNGILVQLEKASLDCNRLKYMYITHGHTDHILGAIWIVRKIATLMLSGSYEGDFNIYTHEKAAGMIRTFCEMTLNKKHKAYVDKRIKINVLDDGESTEIFGMKLTVFDIFSMKEKQYGFSLEYEKGKRLVCLGDEPYNEKCKQYVQGADFLMCEAFCLKRDEDIFKPYEKNHSTAYDAGVTAEKLNVKELLLYHTEDKNLDIRKEAYIREASTEYSGKVYVPDDLDVIKL